MRSTLSPVVVNNMVYFEAEFLRLAKLKLILWFLYVDNIFIVSYFLETKTSNGFQYLNARL